MAGGRGLRPCRDGERRQRGGALSRIWFWYTLLVGAICVGFTVYLPFSTHPRTLRADVLQGVLVGFGLAFVTAQLYGRARAVRVNGWTTMYGLGEPGSGMVMRAAAAQLFPGPVNTTAEAMYWWANVDGAGRSLSGRHDYVLSFPAGALPPNSAFWSLTMVDARNRFVANPLARYSLGDRSGLVTDPDGTVTIRIRHTAPGGQGSDREQDADREPDANWLPAPTGRFLLWLRVYEPGEAILDRTYRVPPVVRMDGDRR